MKRERTQESAESIEAEPLTDTAIFRLSKNSKRFCERRGREEHKGNTGAFLRHIVARARTEEGAGK